MHLFQPKEDSTQKLIYEYFVILSQLLMSIDDKVFITREVSIFVVNLVAIIRLCLLSLWHSKFPGVIQAHLAHTDSDNKARA